MEASESNDDFFFTPRHRNKCSKIVLKERIIEWIKRFCNLGESLSDDDLTKEA